MAPILASPDIAALVAAFPPPMPTRDRPSLVKSHSGNNLLDSRKVLAQFRLLLETSPARIKKADLFGRLNIQDLDWLFDCYDGKLCWSSTMLDLVPDPEARRFAETLKAGAEESFVDVEKVAREHDIHARHCQHLLPAEQDARRFELDDGRQLVAGVGMIQRTNERIFSIVRDARGDKADLSSSMSKVAMSVLRRLSEEVLKQQGVQGGILEEDGRLVYIPSDYHDLQERNRKEAYRSRVSDAVMHVANNGYCELSDQNQTSSMLQDVQNAFHVEHTDTELVVISHGSKGRGPQATIIAKKSLVAETMAELEGLIKSLVQDRRRESATLSLDSLEPLLSGKTSQPRLTTHLLRSDNHRGSLEATVASEMERIDREDAQRFALICQTSLMGPLELYHRGVQTVREQTLQERLDQYICEHFRVEILPAFTRVFEDAGIVHDKTRAKDVEKFATVCAQAKSLTDIQSAINRFSRKQKVPTPVSDQLAEIKQDVLREKIKGVQKMNRGSDVLQNLIWILLAEASQGLFISAGKDTSRMIKQYQAVGDAEKGRRLEEWRDLLKTGKQSDGDVQSMKDMAAEAVESMVGGHFTTNGG